MKNQRHAVESFKPHRVGDVFDVSRNSDVGCQQVSTFALAGQRWCDDAVPADAQKFRNLRPAPSPVHRAVNENDVGHLSLRLTRSFVDSLRVGTAT